MTRAVSSAFIGREQFTTTLPDIFRSLVLFTSSTRSQCTLRSTASAAPTACAGVPARALPFASRASCFNL